jgi:hypothetical protein
MDKNCAVTYRVIGIIAHGCSIAGAVGKDEGRTLPRVSATDANVVQIAIGDFPPFSRHVQRLTAIMNHRAIINSAHMQRSVEVAAVALGNAGYRVWGRGVGARRLRCGCPPVLCTLRLEIVKMRCWEFRKCM